MSTTTTTTTTAAAAVRFIQVPNASAMKNEDHTPSMKARKGSRTSIQLDGAKKPRGRPRLEPHDETAADRRRTQIRLAQRAYRQRKETTIVALKERVAELKQSLDQINKSFTAFNEKALSSGLEGTNNDLATELGETFRIISLLVEEAKVDQEENFDEHLPKSPKHESDDAVDSPASDLDHSKMETVKATPATATSQQIGTSDTDWDSSMVWEPTNHHLNHPEPIPTATGVSANTNDNIPAWMEPFLGQSTDEDSSEPSEDGRPWPLTVLGDLSTFAPELSSHLPLPNSGALEESTFARRLHRATLERGIHIIQGGRLRPRTFAKQFQICLPFCDRTQLLLKIQNMLSRGSGQPLDWTDHPLVHLGGAGLHYQDHGMRVPTSHSKIGNMRVRAIGPSTLALLMNATEQDNTLGKALDIAGFEGEWFSPNDVEGYLAQKGIHIEAGARLQQVMALEEAHSSDQRQPTLECDAEQCTPPQHSLDYLPLGGHATGNSDELSQQTLGDAADEKRPVSSHSWDRLRRDFQRRNERTTQVIGRNLSAREFIERRTMWVDVDRLVKELVTRATCIGRTPGYRRRDVDVAFNKSVAAH